MPSDTMPPDTMPSTTAKVVGMARARARRTTPLGGPWWAYAVPIGLANLVRQLVLRGADTWVQVTTFVLLVIAVTAAVALTWHLLHPGERRGS